MNSVQKNLVRKKIKQKKIKENYTFSTCTYISGKIFSFINFEKIPIMVDLNTGKVTILDNLVNYDLLFVADQMISIGRDIFVLELNGNRLMKYNIEDKKCRYFNIGCNKKNWDNYAAFSNYGKYLYIFPMYANEIVKVNIENGKMEKNGELYSKIYNQNIHLDQKEDFIYFICGCQVKNIMWLFQEHGNIVIAYNMENDTWKEYTLSEYLCNCIHVIYRDQLLYILDSAGKIYYWNMSDKSVELLANCGNEIKEHNIFSRIIATSRKVFVLPWLGEEIFCIDMYTREIEKYDGYPIGFKYCGPENWSKYYGYCEDEKYYYFAMRCSDLILLLEKEKGIIKWIKPNFPSYRDYLKAFMKYKYNGEVISETACELEDMITYVYINSVDDYKSNNNSIGNQIWKQIQMI